MRKKFAIIITFAVIIIVGLLSLSTIAQPNNINRANKPTKADYLGEWYEPMGGRIAITITDKGYYIQVATNGSCSAYTRVESIYTCQYSDNDGVLICKGALHTEITSSCDGIVYEDDPEKYLECEMNHPDSIPDEVRRYSTDNIVRIISVEKGDDKHSVINSDIQRVLNTYPDRPKLQNVVLRFKSNDPNEYDYDFCRDEE